MDMMKEILDGYGMTRLTDLVMTREKGKEQCYMWNPFFFTSAGSGEHKIMPCQFYPDTCADCPYARVPFPEGKTAVHMKWTGFGDFYSRVLEIREENLREKEPENDGNGENSGTEA